MLIKLGSNNCILYHDINGNLIASINEKIYWLDINKNSNLEFIEIKNIGALFDVENGKINYNKITMISENSLKKKLIDSITNEDENDFPLELEDDEQYIQERTVYNYIPESKNYTIEEQEENDPDYYDEEEIKFNFSSLNSNKDIILEEFNKSFDTSAIYDIIVKNNNLVVFTSEAYPYSSYKITILDNLFELNIIGTSINLYKLEYINDNLVFTDVKNDNIISEDKQTIVKFNDDKNTTKVFDDELPAGLEIDTDSSSENDD